jgi:hypothetical protein
MAFWRNWASIVIVLCVGEAALAQSYPLAEPARPGDCVHVQLSMTLTGEMRVMKENKPAALKLAASAIHDYPERVLAVDQGLIQKSARLYDQAKASIRVADERAEKVLRADRRLVVAQWYKGQGLVYAPAGPFTAEELELTNEQFDTLAVVGLLPGKPVPVGETWKVSNDVVQALCSFEGLTSQDLVGKLESVSDNRARFSVAGTSSGIDMGAMVKLTIQATGIFDLGSRRLVELEWRQKDERGQGPVSPATNVESTTTLKRTPIDVPESLSDVALISVPDNFEPPVTMTQIAYHYRGKTSFDLTYAREWQMVGQTPEHIIFRLLDRGDFVAQLTVTPWQSAKKGDHLSPDAFRDAMGKTPGWEQGDIVQEGEVPSEPGLWVYRIAAPGRMDGMKVVQNFFLVAGPSGEQVVLAFTMTPAQAEKLGTRDLAIVRGLEFPKK